MLIFGDALWHLAQSATYLVVYCIEAHEQTIRNGSRGQIILRNLCGLRNQPQLNSRLMHSTSLSTKSGQGQVNDGFRTIDSVLFAFWILIFSALTPSVLATSFYAEKLNDPKAVYLPPSGGDDTVALQSAVDKVQ